MFDTPQEALLKAENHRLRAENEYLRRAVEAPGRTVRPYGIEEEISLRDVPPEIRLVRIGGVESKLAEDGKWHVIGSFERMQDGGRLAVTYYADQSRIDDMTFVNDVLPRLHERFIRQLADIIVKRQKR